MVDDGLFVGREETTRDDVVILVIDEVLDGRHPGFRQERRRRIRGDVALGFATGVTIGRFVFEGRDVSALGAERGPRGGALIEYTFEEPREIRMQGSQ